MILSNINNAHFRAFYLACLMLAMMLLNISCMGGKKYNHLEPNMTYIRVTPYNEQQIINIETQFTAVAHYSDGTTKDYTAEVEWSTSNPAIATFVQGKIGVLVGKSANNCTVLAKYKDITGKTTVYIINKPQL